MKSYSFKKCLPLILAIFWLILFAPAYASPQTSTFSSVEEFIASRRKDGSGYGGTIFISSNGEIYELDFDNPYTVVNAFALALFRDDREMAEQLWPSEYRRGGPFFLTIINDLLDEAAKSNVNAGRICYIQDRYVNKNLWYIWLDVNKWPYEIVEYDRYGRIKTAWNTIGTYDDFKSRKGGFSQYEILSDQTILFPRPSGEISNATPSLNDEEFLELFIRGTPEEIIAAIRGGANANAHNPDVFFSPPLVGAARRGLADVIDLLLENGAYTQTRNRAGKKALSYAEASEELANTEALHKLREISAREFQAIRGDFTELCSDATPEEINKAIQGGADVDERNSGGFTGLMIAILENPNFESIMTLIENGSDVNAKDNHGWPALAWAASDNPNPDVIRALVDNGADVNLRGGDGMTPLIVVVVDNINVNPNAIIKALLEKGADVNAKDDFGKTALHYAQEFGLNDIMELLSTFP